MIIVKPFFSACFNNNDVSSLRMTIVLKHVGDKFDVQVTVHRDIFLPGC